MFKTSGTAQFDKLLEKATSNLLLDPDWVSIMMICDLIRQKDCTPKYALAAIKKKIHHQNPHVAMFGLQVLESIVKNCGSPVHDEVATKQFMEELRELTKTSHHENVKEKILELILTWAHAFRTITSYRAVQEVVNILKAEGAAFKPLQESDAMFVADTAPDWADGECCHRCRTEFGLVVRKHHCRACGQIFCNKCSSKICTLPRFGIEKEVRVCDSCFEKYGKEGSTSDPDDMIMRTAQPLPRLLAPTPAAQPQASGGRTKTEEELAEEEQLQLALAISQSEAEAKEMEAKKRNASAYSYTPAPTAEITSSSYDRENGIEKSSPQKTAETEDPELARYLNRNYWESRSKDESSKEEQTGTAVTKAGGSQQSSAEKTVNKSWPTIGYSFVPSAPIKENKDTAEPVEEIDTFVQNLRSQIEMFVNRMKSNSSRGRPIAYDTSVQGLFMNITALHSQLLHFIQLQDNARSYYEGLQDKLGQIRDARAALDDLRSEHSEKLRRQVEEQERIRQLQMAQKLQIMRQKKQEYLQYQRQLAMKRMQDQEREMQLRIEQQSRPIGAVQNPYAGFPQNPPGMQGYMPPDMSSYMQQQQQQQGVPPSGHMIPPNVSIGYQGQIPMSQAGVQYMPPQGGGQYMPAGHIPPPQQQGQIQMPSAPGVPLSMGSQHMIPQQAQNNMPPQQQQQQTPNFHQAVPGTDSNPAFHQQQQQHQVPPQAHNVPMSPQQQQPPQIQNVMPFQQQEQPNFHQNHTVSPTNSNPAFQQQQQQGPPPSQPLPQNEVSTAELISFDD